MLKNKDNVKVLGKKTCKCGRKIVVARDKEGRLPNIKIICSTCKTLGFEESRRLFLENCIFKIARAI